MIDVYRASLRAERREVVYRAETEPSGRIVLRAEYRAIPGQHYPAVMTITSSGGITRTLLTDSHGANLWAGQLQPTGRLRRYPYMDCPADCPGCGGQGCAAESLYV